MDLQIRRASYKNITTFLFLLFPCGVRLLLWLHVQNFEARNAAINCHKHFLKDVKALDRLNDVLLGLLMINSTIIICQDVSGSLHPILRLATIVLALISIFSELL